MYVLKIMSPKQIKPNNPKKTIKQAFIYLLATVICFFTSIFDKSEATTAPYPFDIPNKIKSIDRVELNAA